MKFKEGQRVILKRNLGKINEHERDEYYYGGTTERVPLGTRAKIEKIIGEEDIRLSLENQEGKGDNRWFAHPNELILAEDVEEKNGPAAKPLLKKENEIEINLDELNEGGEIQRKDFKELDIEKINQDKNKENIPKEKYLEMIQEKVLEVPPEKDVRLKELREYNHIQIIKGFLNNHLTQEELRALIYDPKKMSVNDAEILIKRVIEARELKKQADEIVREDKGPFLGIGFNEILEKDEELLKERGVNQNLEELLKDKKQRKFKVGQEVIVARNLGEKNGYEKNEYYHGRGINELKLGAKGVIREIDQEGDLFLELDGGGVWFLHPDEADLVNKIPENEKEKVIDELEQLLIEEEPEFNPKRKFLAGQQVVLVKNLGIEAKIDKDLYFNGKRIREVPLGSKAKIKEILPNGEVYLITDNGQNMHADPREIEIDVEYEEDLKRREQKKLEDAIFGGVDEKFDEAKIKDFVDELDGKEKRFQVNQKIVIARRLGKANQKGKREYFYGGGEELQIGMKGIVREIEGKNKIIINTDNGWGYRLHPNELQTEMEYFEENNKIIKRNLEQELLAEDPLEQEEPPIEEEPLPQKQNKKQGLRFKPGQEVIVARNLGERNGRGRKHYFHEGDVNELPLGTKIKIDSYCESGDRHYRVRLNGRKICLIDEELELIEEKFKPGQKVVVIKPLGEKNNQSKGQYFYGVTLKQLPLGKKAIVKKSDGERVLMQCEKGMLYDMHPNEIKLIEEENNQRLDPDLGKELMQDVLEDKQEKRRPFNPKFNGKNEFAVWVRDQFPDLKKYANKKEPYLDLDKRINEVRAAIKKAWEGVDKATHHKGRDRYCHRNFLGPKFERFQRLAETQDGEKSRVDYTLALETVVEALELSIKPNFPYIDEVERFRGLI